MLYCYLKTRPKNRGYFHLVSSGLMAVGAILLANVFLPIFLYQFQTRRLEPRFISPLVDSISLQASTTVVLGVNSSLGAGSPGFDSTKPDKWFPAASKMSAWQSRITHYNLTIPKLKIEEAVVQMGGDDLSQSLIHYLGTALPGQYGNAVIFGHSVLPQFFNPKKYKTIFSTLPTLEKGDEMLINFDGVLYRYRVIEMVEVSPEDVSVLEQRYDAEYLSLVTCVPPGTYLRRLVIRARLARF